MGKFKAPKSKKSAVASNLKALPCLFLILMIFALIMLLLYFGLRSSS
jgi:hypothetical protein